MLRRISVDFGIGAAAGVIVAISFVFGLFSGIEHFIEDSLFTPRPVDSRIVILAIDNESLQKIGQWPWPREVFARVFSALEANPPQAVGLDVIFAEPSRAGPKDDLALTHALQNTSYPVIVPVEGNPLFIRNGGRVSVPSLLKTREEFLKSERVFAGHVNLVLDQDGVARRFPMEILAADARTDSTYKAFAYELVEQSGTVIPSRQDGNIERIVYAAPSGSIKKIPVWRILEGDITRELAGRIVIIGATAADLHDEKPTPLGRGAEMPGVEIQANIANMLLSGYRLIPLSGGASLAWIIFAAIFPAAAFNVFRRSLKPLFASILLGIGYIFLAFYLFERGIVVNIVHLSLAWFISAAAIFAFRFLSGERERREIKKLFSKYVSSEVLELILRDPGRVTLGGEEKEITVFFSDIRGFTSISEEIGPQKLVRLLNTYFTAMSDEILRSRGVLDKYIGDAVMAFWGAPIDDPDQADNALKAAKHMLTRLDEVNKILGERGDPKIDIGIGIYTGPAIVGNIGSESRFDYTVIGDTVNVASRLEGLNKEYKTRIIVGESTKKKAKDTHNFIFLGEVAVKGRAEPLKIYTL